MRIKKATRRYESWLGQQTHLLETDLVLKHSLMDEGAFPFLRATFYRWAQLFPIVCRELAGAPHVLAVGDLHVENFGTWRDAEGRLIWGINDFDEVHPLAYTNDLVRLAASARLAIEASNLRLPSDDACKAILMGYTESLRARGRAFVLDEEHEWLRAIALNELRDPVHFWSKLESAPTATEKITRGALKVLESLLPESDLSYRIVHRVAGMGSLGRERWVALAEWRGGKIAREVKGLAPSACEWAEGVSDNQIHYQEILVRAVRCPDPLLRTKQKWLVRRLAPDCTRIELSDLPVERDEFRLLHAMGWETANVHLGSRRARSAVWLDLQKRSAGWLHMAAADMAHAVTDDWSEWKRANGETGQK